MIHRRLPPGNAAAVNRRDISALQRRTRPVTEQRGGWEYWEIEFSQRTLALEESGRYYPPFPCELYEAAGSLKTAGSSTTTVEVAIDGGLQGTIDLVSSDHFEKIDMANGMQADVDYVTVETTAIGTGAEGLVVSLRFRRRA